MTSKYASVISPISSNISPLPAPTTFSSYSSTLSPSPTSSPPNQATDPLSSSKSSSSSPSPTSSPPNQTNDSLPSSARTNSSSPPPQSPSPAAPIAPPPSPLLSTPTALTVPPASPPPSIPASLAPSPPASPPPSLPTSPPSASAVPPASKNSPPSPLLSPSVQSSVSPPPLQVILRSPPPPANVPTRPSSKSPPPARSPPESASPPPPANVPTRPSSKSPPSPPARSPSESAFPPPPANASILASAKSPPSLPATSPPKSSSSPPMLAPTPSSSKSAPPPAITSFSTPTFSFPPPSVSSTSSPPTLSPAETPSTLSTTRSPSSSPLPSIPTERQIADSTTGNIASPNTTSSGKNGLGAVAIGIVVGFVVLSLLVMVVWFAHKRKRKRAGPKTGYNMPSPFASSQNSDSAFLRAQSPHQIVGKGSDSGFYSPAGPDAVNNSRSWFTYEELLQATKGFSERNLLGEGGFGCVYKGILTDGREVAVKQLKIGGGQGEREFRAEVEIIGPVHHRHLVSLVGYCILEQKRLLVYDYVPNNTLHYHLHGRGRPVMGWTVRVKVAVGAARGVAYLHEDCHPRIIHRDIKASNILLDNNFDAHVSDFGLAKLALDTNTHVTTRVMGTFGYMAPEYARTGKLTEKSDVYSFGVVLLELITGRKPVDDSQPLGDESLVEWARPLLGEAIEHQDFEELADPRLKKNYVDHEMFRMMEAAAACVRHSAAKRPKMSQVVRALNSLDESSDLTNGMRPGQSEVFDSAQQSAKIRMFQRLAFGSKDYSSGSFYHTQSSWGSQEDGSQCSGRSQEYGNHSDWSQEHSGDRALLP